jgi:hypothetical protein
MNKTKISTILINKCHKDIGSCANCKCTELECIEKLLKVKGLDIIEN